MKNYVLGVDIGGTTAKLGFFTVEGELLDKWEIITRKEEEGKYILTDVAKALEDKLVERGVTKDDVVGVGIGVPGPVTDDGRVLKCVNLGWGVFNVEEEFEKIFGLPVKSGNDANMAALGEIWQGGGRGHKSIVMVTLGTGVGGGIISNGKVLPGANGAGGEIGHIHVNDNETESCGCGKKGCLEQYTSATGVVRMAEKFLKESDKPSVLRSSDYVTAKEIFDAAKDGDELALDIVEEHGKCFGKALASIACVCDPEAFVIGGGVSRAGYILLETTEKYYRQYAFHACQNAKFVLAKLGNDAGVYGCAAAILAEQE